MNPNRGDWVHAPCAMAWHRYHFCDVHPANGCRFIGIHPIGIDSFIPYASGHCTGRRFLCSSMVHPSAVEKFASRL